MGTGYTRNDTANNIADGNVINASDLDGEFDAVQAAFNASTGHSHDGTTGEGPQIGTGGIADTAVTTAKIADLNVTTGKIANDAVTLGTKTSGNYVATGAVSGVGLSGSASSEGATFTVTSNATNANTASTIVARDASGNFSAGTITANLSGNATTATTATTANSVATNSVALGTDTTGNYIATGAVSGVGLSGSASSEGATFTVTSNATSSNTASTIVARDASGNFSAGTITATLSGNATTATTASNVTANSVALGTDTTGNYIASLTVGTGLDTTTATGEGSTPNITLDLSELPTSSTNGDGDFFVVVDSSNVQRKITKGNIAISGFNNDSGFTTNVGDITNVTAGTGLSGGGASGSVTLALDMSELTDMTATMVGTDEFIVLDGGEDRRKAANEIGLSIFNNDAGFSTTTGTVTSVGITAGAGIDVSGSPVTSSGNITVSIESDLRSDVFQIGRDTNDYYIVNTTTHDWYLDGVLDMRLENDGDLHVDGDVIAFSTTTSSDEKLKDNITVVEDALAKVEQLRGVEFEWKKDGSKSAGVIAQDVEKVLPQAVKTVSDLNSEEEYKTVSYDALHALLIEAIKELKTEIEELKNGPSK